MELCKKMSKSVSCLKKIKKNLKELEDLFTGVKSIGSVIGKEKELKEEKINLAAIPADTDAGWEKVVAKRIVIDLSNPKLPTVRFKMLQ